MSSAMSHTPAASRLRAVPMASVPEAQVVVTARLGPVARRSWETLLTTLLTLVRDASLGETRRAPFSMRMVCCAS